MTQGASNETDSEEPTHGGRRAGSGRKAGVTDGRRRISIRIKTDVLKALGPRPARVIRALVEGWLKR